MFFDLTCHQDHVADYSTQSAAMDFMAGFSPADGFLPDHPEYVVRQNGKFEYQFIGVKLPRREAFYINIRLDFTVEL